MNNSIEKRLRVRPKKDIQANKIIHSDVAILHFETEDVPPGVPSFDKVKTEKLGGGFFQIIEFGVQLQLWKSAAGRRKQSWGIN